jgi:hypothetical protein
MDRYMCWLLTRESVPRGRPWDYVGQPGLIAIFDSYQAALAAGEADIEERYILEPADQQFEYWPEPSLLAGEIRWLRAEVDGPQQLEEQSVREWWHQWWVEELRLRRKEAIDNGVLPAHLVSCLAPELTINLANRQPSTSHENEGHEMNASEQAIYQEIVVLGADYDMPPHEVDENGLDHVMVSHRSSIYCIVRTDEGWEASREDGWQEWTAIAHVKSLYEAMAVIREDAIKIEAIMSETMREL